MPDIPIITTARNTLMIPVNPDSPVHSPASSAQQIPNDFSVQSMNEALRETRTIIVDASLPSVLRWFLIRHGDLLERCHPHKDMTPCGWSGLATRLNRILSVVEAMPEYEVHTPLQRIGSDDMVRLALAPGALVFCNEDNDGVHDVWHVSLPRTMTTHVGETDPDAHGVDHDFFVVTTTTTDTPYRVKVSSPLPWEYFQREHLPLTR